MLNQSYTTVRAMILLFPRKPVERVFQQNRPEADIRISALKIGRQVEVERSGDGVMWGRNYAIAASHSQDNGTTQVTIVTV
jgi:hypothetical protein